MPARDEAPHKKGHARADFDAAVHDIEAQARATNEKSMARFAPFGAMRFAEIAEGDVASALW